MVEAAIKILSTLTRGEAGQLLMVRAALLAGNISAVLLHAYLLPKNVFGEFVYLWATALAMSVVCGMGGQLLLLREMSARAAGDGHGRSFKNSFILAVVYPGMFSVAAGGVGYLLLDRHQILDALPIDAGDWLASCLLAYVVNLLVHSSQRYRVAGASSLSMLMCDGVPYLSSMLVLLVAEALVEATPGLLIASTAAVCCFAVIASEICFPHTRAARDTQLFRATIATDPPLPPVPFAFWGGSTLSVSTAHIDILIGGLFLAPAELGAYQLLKRAANLLALPLVVLDWLVIVKMGQLVALRKYAEIQELCAISLRRIISPYFILLIGIVFIVFPLFFYIYDYSISGPAIGALLILVLVQSINLYYGANYALAAQSGLERVTLASRLAALILSVTFIFLVGSHLSSVLLAISALVAAGVSNYYVWVILKRRLDVDTSLRFAMYYPNSTDSEGRL